MKNKSHNENIKNKSNADKFLNNGNQSILFNIQYLRAFAAINVVVYHIIGTASDYNYNVEFLMFLQGWGANGVDIFFVISGFVMYHTQCKNRVTSLEFFKARILRIVPLYYLLTTCIIFVYFLFPMLFRSFDPSLKLFLTSFLFMSQFINSSFPVIYPGWTLEWEMLFYIIFSICLFFKDFNKVILSLLSCLFLSSILTENLIILEFALGILCGFIFNKYKINLKIASTLFLIGSILLIISVFDIFKSMNIDRFFLWGVPSFFIVLGAAYSNQIKSEILLYLGNASYSIYLSHIFTVTLFYKVSTNYIIGLNGDYLAIFCLTLSIIGGCVLYSFIEKPMIFMLRRR